jgi:hypothetical protein
LWCDVRVADLTAKEADALAGELRLELGELEICYACLSFVAYPLDLGREDEAARESRRIAPDLWAEGLALPLQGALELARVGGVLDAARAVDEVARRGPRAPIVAAVIRVLAAQLVAQMRATQIGGRNGNVTLLR